ncbi:hypothetical protein RIF29_23147 [Crotalaria pallida]|uniref:TF-B3 domain-containing protein n=1 Tax=Crotalaria pallida TaxID=3830 RepID=A0AAN9I8G5_CROPI
MDAHRSRGDAILPIRFFKFILKTNLVTIKIPNKFAKRYGLGMPNPVFLKPPDGTEWKVTWTKKNGEFWFEKGWKEFTENYSLDHGDLVMFKYEGTSQFDVIIVDKGNLEIEYPASVTNCDEEMNLGESDDESVEILDELEVHKAGQKPPTTPHKKTAKGEKASQKDLSLNWPREPRAQEVAKKFASESDNPFFTKYIKHVHVAEGRLSVPDMEGYIENKTVCVKLQLGQRSWHVKLLGSPNPSTRRFSAGFSLFATESELRPGDICVFELISREDIVFKNYRINTAPQLPTQSMDAHLNRGDAILPIRFFKFILKTNLETIKIPNKFTKRYGDGMSNNPAFLKPPDGTKWKVHWTKKNGECWFEKGWKEFTENYSLEEGDLVVFKYEGTSQFEVNVLDQSKLEINYPPCGTCDEEENLHQSDDKSLIILDECEGHKGRQKPPIPLSSAQPHKEMRDEKATGRGLSMNWPGEPRAREVAKSFISESNNPFFTKYIKPVHVAENYLSVPDMDGYVENKSKDVILQLGQRSWHVKLLGSHKPSRRRFSAGWSLFASETQLHPGDVCIFELVNREDTVFKVHVFKSHN